MRARPILSSTLSLLVVTLAGDLALAQPGAAADGSVAIATDDGAGRELARERSGFTFGLSIGRGSIDIECDRCGNVDSITEGLSYSGHVGLMVLPMVAIVGEHWSVRYNDRGTEWFDDSADHLIAQRLSTVGAQVWLGRLWVRGGLGVGWHISDSRYAKPALYDDPNLRSAAGAGQVPEDESFGKYAPAATAALGFEFARSYSNQFALDVQLRAATTRRPADEYQIHNAAVVFGATWF